MVGVHPAVVAYMKPALVQVTCPHCRKAEVFPASHVGRRVECHSSSVKYKLPAGAPFGAEEWDACPTPGPLRQCLKVTAYSPPPRVNAAFGVALARAVYPKLGNVWLRRAVAFAEKFQATGKAPIDEVAELLDGLLDGEPPWARPLSSLLGICCLSGDALGWPGSLAADAKHPHLVADLIRECVPNPFRPRPRWAAWRTDTVRALARTMSDARDFSARPILADALQDAGCTNEHVLAHCRADRPHVRGCWVLDAILGKS